MQHFSFCVWLISLSMTLPRASGWLKWWRICLPTWEPQERWVRSLGWGDPLEEEMATHSSILGRMTPQTDKPSRLQYLGLQKSNTTKHASNTKCNTLQVNPWCHKDNISFLGWVIFHCSYIPHFLSHSSMDGQTDCFHIFATVSNAAVNTGVYTHWFNFLCIYAR